MLTRARSLLGDRFEPTRLLGRGGMAAVVLAHHRALGRDVAIKLLPEELKTDPVATARFLREARACAKLAHTNIVTVHDVDEDAGFIVMELVEGESLRTRLRRKGRLSPEENLLIGSVRFSRPRCGP